MRCRWVAGAAVVVLAGAAAAVAARGHATASPAPASPEVAVAVAGAVVRVPLTAVLAAPASVGGDQPAAAVGGTPVATGMASDGSVTLALDAQPGASDTVTAMRTAGGAVLGRTGTSSGGTGGDVAFSPLTAGRAFSVGGTDQLYDLTVDPAPALSGLVPLGSIEARSLAVSPDGATVYVGGQDPTTAADVVVAVNAATGQQVGRWEASTPNGGSGVTGLAVSPDGTRLFGADGASLLSAALPFTATTALTPASAPGLATVTAGPSGADVYGAGSGASGAFALAAPAGDPGALATRTVAGSGTASVAVDPAGTALVVAVGAGGGPVSLDPVPLAGAALGQPGAVTLASASGPPALAITPDQAPVAAISAHAAAAGSATTLDASASAVAYGSITSYRWSFGDGSAGTTTATPTTSHTYPKAGSFTATVTETDSAGTSVPTPGQATVLTAGHTAYRVASPSAAASTTVAVPAAGTPSPSTTSPTTAPPAGPAGQPGGPPLVALPSTARLTAFPPAGPPGTIVTVIGTGFAPATSYTLAWSVSIGSVAVDTDAAGGFRAELPTVVPDVVGPRDVIVPGATGVAAPFLVEPGAVEPGGASAAPLFRSDGG